MSTIEEKCLSDRDMFEALQEAGKLYDEYLDLQRVTDLTELLCVEQEEYNRDINYPLNIVLR
jgi:hypothetical protein